jgi:hypothetical protein
MSKEPDEAALSIGVVLGDYDAENKAWDAAITTLMKQVKSIREGVESPLRLNVVYHVDGKQAPNEFEGVRTGRFSKKDAHLMVQAAVPAHPVDDRRQFLVRLLEAAVDEAERFAARRGISQDLGEIRALVDRLPAE